MKSTGRKTVKVERVSAPLKKTARAAKKSEATAVETTEAAVDTGTVVDAKATPAPTHDEIAKRSYAIYLARGGDQGWGSPEQDWLQAERELRAR